MNQINRQVSPDQDESASETSPMVESPPGLAPYPAAVAKAITKVMGGDLYVQKKGRNNFHNYNYATVGDLLDKIQPMMADAGLVILQNEIDMNFHDEGKVMAVKYEFTLAHASGVVWSEKIRQTGMSSCRNQKGGFDDKASNKCHTAARKYFILGLFQVPTGEDRREPLHDGDADEQEDKPSLTPEDITKIESEVTEKLALVKDQKALDDLWRSGVNARVREIGQVDKEAQKRIITAFSAKKGEVQGSQEPKAA